MKLSTYLHKLFVGFRLRCPNCEKGGVYQGFSLKPRELCPICGVRFERREGESIGGAMLNLVVVETSGVVGFFVVDALTDIQPVTQLWFWIPYAILMPLLLYRNTRALWIAVSYMNGDVYADGQEPPSKS